MWAYSGGLILLGVLLGAVWRRTPGSVRLHGASWVIILAAIATVALAAILADGWTKFLLMLLQAPMVGGAIASRPVKA